MKKVSIRSLAGITGFAPCTVSRALQANSNVGSETRARVLQAAREYGYVAETARTPRICAIVAASDFYDGAYDCVMIKHLLLALARHGIEGFVTPGDNLRLLQERWFDGAISICYDAEIDRCLSENFGFPLVSVNNYSRHIAGVFSVASDEEQMMRAAIGHFRKLGHRDIGILALDCRRNFSHLRRNASFKRIMKEEFNLNGHVYWIASHESELARVIRDGVTALLYPAEPSAALMRAIQSELQVKIPRCLSLITLENPGLSPYVTPPVTTFAQNFPLLAERAVSLWLQVVSDPSAKVQDELIPYRFICRKSTAPPGISMP